MTTPRGSHHPPAGGAGMVSPLLQSRVGRDTQRYDGACRLLACSVIVRQEREVLLISSSKHPGAWILPKGGWEEDETLDQCALREAEEEAGVAGAIAQSLGECEFATSKGARCRLYGFLLTPAQQYDVWAEQSRQRQWVSFSAARDLLAYRPELVTMLSRAQDCFSPRATDSDNA